MKMDWIWCKVFIESNTNEDKMVERKSGEDIEGNLEFKGPNVFIEYFNQEKQTKESFANDIVLTSH